MDLSAKLCGSESSEGSPVAAEARFVSISKFVIAKGIPKGLKLVPCETKIRKFVRVCC